MYKFDVIIIGGGPAGLNAGVVLGRSRRSVLLIDHGRPRNRNSHGMHNYLTRDDILPREFIKISRAELKKYGVTLLNAKARNACMKNEGHFMVTDHNGKLYHSKKLLLATGLRDKLPNLPNFDQFYGKSIFHCPYCDGWEFRDKKMGVYARNKDGSELALSLLTWTDSVTYFTNGGRKLSDSKQKDLEKLGIRVVREKISSLEGRAGKLKHIKLDNEEKLALDCLFFVNGFDQQSDLLKELGCKLTSKHVAVTNRFQQTNIPGLFVAGDAARDMHFVVVAAAEGAKAGVTINKELQKEGLLSRARKARK